jgi:hypothetical protein
VQLGEVGVGDCSDVQPGEDGRGEGGGGEGGGRVVEVIIDTIGGMGADVGLRGRFRGIHIDLHSLLGGH